jgi:hypothetical protein
MMAVSRTNELFNSSSGVGRVTTLGNAIDGDRKLDQRSHVGRNVENA